MVDQAITHSTTRVVLYHFFFAGVLPQILLQILSVLAFAAVSPLLSTFLVIHSIQMGTNIGGVHWSLRRLQTYYRPAHSALAGS